jgi:SAM-dependent methyltransferase
MNQQHFHQKLDEDLGRLKQFLHQSLHDLPPKPNHPDNLRILNLACGNCHEAEILADHFANPPSSSLHSPAESRVELVGVDIRQREIADARARCREYLKDLAQSEGAETAQQRSFEFLAADATMVGSHRELCDPFDVVFLRHQNFWHDRDIWHDIFQQGLEKLSPGGTLILTSYFDREHALALQAVQHLGGELITSVENEASRKLRSAAKSVDKHLAVFRKRL